MSLPVATSPALNAPRIPSLMLERAITKKSLPHCDRTALHPQRPVSNAKLRSVILQAFDSGIVDETGLYACHQRGTYIHLAKCGRLSALLPRSHTAKVGECGDKMIVQDHSGLSEVLAIFATYGVTLGLNQPVPTRGKRHL